MRLRFCGRALLVSRDREGDPFAKAGCFGRVSISPYRIVFKDGAKAE